MRSRLRILTYNGELSAPQGDKPLMPRDIQRKPIPSRDGDDKRNAVTVHKVTNNQMIGGAAIPLTPKPQTPKFLTSMREWLINTIAIIKSAVPDSYNC